MGCLISTQTSPSFSVKVHALFGVDRGGSPIVCNGGDCRCEISLQVIRHLMSNSVSKMPILGGGLDDFSVGVEIY